MSQCPRGLKLRAWAQLYIVSGAARRQLRNLPLPGYQRWGEIPRDGELSKPVLLNAGPRHGAHLWSVIAVHPWLRQFLKPLEFALQTASDAPARGWIGPGSRGLCPRPSASPSPAILGGLLVSPLDLQPHGLFLRPPGGAGVGDQVSPSPRGISPGIAGALHQLTFPLTEGKD